MGNNTATAAPLKAYASFVSGPPEILERGVRRPLPKKPAGFEFLAWIVGEFDPLHSESVQVVVADRRHPERAQVIELDRSGKPVVASVRPLLWRQVRQGALTYWEPDLEAVPPDCRELLPKDLRAVRWQPAFHAAHAAWRRYLGGLARGTPWHGALEKRRWPGRPPKWDEAQLVRIAEAYASVAGSGRENHKVAERFGLTARAARDLVKKARWRGLLLPKDPGKGRAVGRLSKRGQRILAEAEATPKEPIAEPK